MDSTRTLGYDRDLNILFTTREKSVMYLINDLSRGSSQLNIGESPFSCKECFGRCVLVGVLRSVIAV